MTTGLTETHAKYATIGIGAVMVEILENFSFFVTDTHNKISYSVCPPTFQLSLIIKGLPGSSIAEKIVLAAGFFFGRSSN